MKEKTIVSLRNYLFETLTALTSTENPMDIDRAKAICEVSQTIINSAKVEVDFMRISGKNSGTGFLEAPEIPKETITIPTPPLLKVTTHRIK